MRWIHRKNVKSPQILYWGQENKIKNIGDYLSVYIQNRLFGPPKANCPSLLYIIGSVIADPFVELARGEQVGFWGCGMRGPQSLSSKFNAKAKIFGVRGFLSQACLFGHKPPVVGDTSFLIPLLYQPDKSRQDIGKSIFIPHLSDLRTVDAMKHETGAESILVPLVDGTEKAIESWIDSLSSAEFVLSGSLHGLILSFLYNVPCAIYGAKPLDCPFKWLDFLSSIDRPLTAHETVKSAKANSPLQEPDQAHISVRGLLETCPFEINEQALTPNPNTRVIWP